MSDVPSGAVTPADDGDDDALADAILASYTSSIPIIRPSAVLLPPGAELFEDDEDDVDADAEAPLAPVPAAPVDLQPEPEPEPEPEPGPEPEPEPEPAPDPESPTSGPVPVWAPESPVSPTPWWQTAAATQTLDADPAPTVGQPIPWGETVAPILPPRSAADDSVWDLGAPVPGSDGGGGTMWDLGGSLFAPTPPVPDAVPVEADLAEATPAPSAEGEMPTPDAPLAGPAAESFDFPPPDDEGIPIDLSGTGMPQPWTEFPAPAAESIESDGESWPHPTDEPVTPFSPRPFPTPQRESWTTIVEPPQPDEGPATDAPDAEVDPDLPAFATAPPPDIDAEHPVRAATPAATAPDTEVGLDRGPGFQPADAGPLAPIEPPFDETLLGTYVSPSGQSPIEEFLRANPAVPGSTPPVAAPPVAAPPGADPIIQATPAGLASAPPPNPDSAVDLSAFAPPTGEPVEAYDDDPPPDAPTQDAPWDGAPAPDFTPPTLVEPPLWSPVSVTGGDGPSTAESEAVAADPEGEPNPDLAAAPEPLAESRGAHRASATVDSAPEPAPEPGPVESLPWLAAGDADYADDDDGSVDPGDRAPLSAPTVAPTVPSSVPPSAGPITSSIPLGTVQTTILPFEPLLPIPATAPPLDTAPPAAPLRALAVETAGREPTPLEQRTGRAARMFWLWFAANASALSIGLGAVVLLLGLSLRQAIIATLVGAALSFLPIGFSTLAGKWSGQPTLVTSRATFGVVGNVLPTILGVVTRAVWGGILLWIAASGVGAIIDPRTPLSAAGLPSVGLVSVVTALVLTAVVALVGYGLVARVQLVLTIVSALLVIGLIALTIPEVHLTLALERGDGPWEFVVGGAVLVFSYIGLAWVQSGGDLARYQRPSGRSASTMLWASLGAALPAFALIAWGALLAASSPTLARELVRSPVSALASVLPSWYPVPLLLAVAIGALSGAVISIYSGGFAVLALGAPLRRTFATLIAALLTGAVGVSLVLSGADARVLTQNMVIALAVPVAAWAGIFGAEMMIRHRRFHAPSLLVRGDVYPTVRVGNLVALVVITVIGYGLTSATVSWLSWQGYLFSLLGVAPAAPLAATDVGVLVALVLGLLVPFATAIPAIRRQEAGPPAPVASA